MANISNRHAAAFPLGHHSLEKVNLCFHLFALWKQLGPRGGWDALYWAEQYWLGNIKISLTNSFSNLIMCCPHNWIGKREVESLKRSKLNTYQEEIPVLCVCAILCIVAPWLYIEHALFDSLVLSSLFIKDSCLQIGAFSIQLARRRSSL